MIEVQDLHRSFGQLHVLRGINLTVQRGTTQVILGLSGSGKTVLMKHIIGLLHPDSGHVFIDGEDTVDYDIDQKLALRRKFGMVFQHAALFDSMTVFDNIAFPLREHTDLSEEQMAERVAEKLELVDMGGVEDKFPSELSGGMRKRVGLARAVILDPEYLLYDEPTTGLDPITTQSVDEMIIDAAERLNVTSIVISHDVGSALKVGDSIAVIHEGQIVAAGSSDDIRASDHPFVQRFIATWFGKQ